VGPEVVYLVRHGKSVTSHPDGDRFRPLSNEGRLRIEGMIPQAHNHGFKADLALSSPYLRAVQTRDLFVPVLGPSKTATSADFTPDSDPVDAVEELSAWAAQGYDRIAVFTHNPFVTALAELLVTPGSVPNPAVDALVFDTPSILAVRFPQGFGRRLGRAEWILHP
jgi:phosphohistidine phosphatase